MFIERPASKKSLGQRKPVYGVGINDADYVTGYMDGGRLNQCPYYRVWINMFVRCYSDSFHKKSHTYKGCSVSLEWIKFSAFKEWMKLSDWKGMHLDKDLLYPNNRVYGPDECIFVTPHINSLITDSKAARGAYPIGVCFSKSHNKFSSRCNVNGKKITLGYFDSANDAAKTYREFKASHIEDLAKNYGHDSRLYSALIRRAEFIRNS